MKEEEREYLEELVRLYRSQKTLQGLREESYYPLLLKLFEGKGIVAIQLPAKTEAGFPDIKVSKKDGYIIGYIECKRPEEPLQKGLLQKLP